MYYNVDMAEDTRPFSVRMGASVLERLERRGVRSATNKSRLAERYIDEGLRLDDHPGIAFRDGPTGRRAGLVAGPDVWEVVQVVLANGSGQRGVGAAAEWGRLSEREVRFAMRYYSEFPDEVDERIRRNLDEAEAAEAAWLREQAALR